jgi:hypothetical protein
LQHKIDDEKIQLSKKTVEQIKEVEKQLFEVGTQFLESMAVNAESAVNSLAGEISYQQEVINQQRTQAQLGQANDLAFEEKHQADLQKEKIKAEKKLAAIKEAEVFINSVAKFSEDDPKTAIPKALAILAATKSVEAIYKEEGGIIGHGGPMTRIGGTGFSRLHPGGGDVLVHAQTGEGMLSRREMSNLGINNFHAFKSMLKTPFHEKLIPNQNMLVQDNAAVIDRLESLERTIKNKAEYHLDVDALNNFIETKVENGIRTVTKHVNNKTRRI